MCVKKYSASKRVKNCLKSVWKKNLCEMCMCDYMVITGSVMDRTRKMVLDSIFSEYSEMLRVKLQSLIQSCMQLDHSGSAWKWRAALYERKNIKCVINGDIFQGVFDGVTGIVRKPMEGAKQEGVSGFFKGIVPAWHL